MIVRTGNFVASRNVPVVTLPEFLNAKQGDSSCCISPSTIDVSEGGRKEGDGNLEPGDQGGVVQAVSMLVSWTGLIRMCGSKHSVHIPHDTDALVDVDSVDRIIMRGVTGSMSAALVGCEVECDLFKGLARAELVDCLPESGVNLILGNALGKGEEIDTPVLSTVSVPVAQADENCETLPMCTVTRSMALAEERRKGMIIGLASCVDVPETSSAVPDDSTPQDISLSVMILRSIDKAPSVAVEGVDVERLLRL